MPAVKIDENGHFTARERLDVWAKIRRVLRGKFL